ncbi:glycoside hydrolase family 36 protein [Xylariaceae sp. AK1471]|nr:glycoside hydrolase family 36 protein [Xylariaceae sp. AK1471]
MFLRVGTLACDPPLGVATVISASSVQFRVAIDITEHTNSSLEVFVWHEAATGWRELQLQPAAPHDQSPTRIKFEGRLEKHETALDIVRYTLRVTVDGQSSWVNDFDHQQDGLLVFQTEHPLERFHDLNGLFSNSDESLDFDPVVRDSANDCITWIGHSLVSESTGDVSSLTKLNLGLPIRVLKWFSLVRHSTPWLGPRQGDYRFHLDKPGVASSFLREDGLHVVVLPVNGIQGTLVTLESGELGNVLVAVRNDLPERRKVHIVISAAKSSEIAFKGAVSAASGLLLRPDAVEDTANQHSLEEWYDGFSYCTWNGLGRELSEQGILAALNTLSDHGIVISNLIIDDNWQSLDTQGFSDPFTFSCRDFEATKANFPHGLAHTIQRIRESHRSIRHISVWHGIFGYWGGISPTGHVAKCYATTQVQRQSIEPYMAGGDIIVVSPSDVHRMYDDFYSFLVDCGVDSVKADNQYYPDYLDRAQDRASTMYAYQDAWLSAATKHFGHRAISCMSQTPQILFHSFIRPSDRPPYLVRNSDDFFPNEPSSHSWHLFSNAHNAVLTQHLNLLPDWDMFQTAGVFPALHAAARCLSGGPIYITDVPGDHDLDLINQITGLDSGGRLKILRPSTKGRATEVYNKAHGNRFLHIAAAHHKSVFLGLFNLETDKRMEIVTTRSFPDLDAQHGYIVKSHIEDKIYDFSRNEGILDVSISPMQFDILTAFPISRIGTLQYVILGLIGKMTGAAALAETPTLHKKDGLNMFLNISLKALGSLSVWLKDETWEISQKPLRAEIFGQPVDCSSVGDVYSFDLVDTWQQISGTVSPPPKLFNPGPYSSRSQTGAG